MKVSSAAEQSDHERDRSTQLRAIVVGCRRAELLPFLLRFWLRLRRRCGGWRSVLTVGGFAGLGSQHLLDFLRLLGNPLDFFRVLGFAASLSLSLRRRFLVRGALGAFLAQTSARHLGELRLDV